VNAHVRPPSPLYLLSTMSSRICAPVENPSPYHPSHGLATTLTELSRLVLAPNYYTASHYPAKLASTAPCIVATLLRKRTRNSVKHTEASRRHKVVSQMETAAKIDLTGQPTRMYITAERRSDWQLLESLHSTCHGLCSQPCWRHPHLRRHLNIYNGVSLFTLLNHTDVIMLTVFR
jgi:hypothetical protein